MEKMKKIIAFVLTLLLLLSLTGTATAYWNEDWVPGGDWLGYSGEICVYFTHDYSITFRDYTAEDFPGLEIEYIQNHWINPDMDIEEMKNNEYFIRTATVTIKNTDKESVRSAVYYLDSLPYVDEAVAISNYYRYGDVNCDRTIDLLDVTHMLKYIAKWESISIEYPHRTGDMDFDGVINMSDVLILLKALCGWNVFYEFEAGPY